MKRHISNISCSGPKRLVHVLTVTLPGKFLAAEASCGHSNKIYCRGKGAALVMCSMESQLEQQAGCRARSKAHNWLSVGVCNPQGLEPEGGPESNMHCTCTHAHMLVCIAATAQPAVCPEARLLCKSHWPGLCACALKQTTLIYTGKVSPFQMSRRKLIPCPPVTDKVLCPFSSFALTNTSVELFCLT